MRVPRQGTGAEQPVVAKKPEKDRGSEGVASASKEHRSTGNGRSQ